MSGSPSSHLGVLDVEHLPIARSWYVVNRKGKSPSLVAGAFRNYLREYTTASDHRDP
ncbi:hypothetical protein [Acidiferrobacter sp. SPIII_3]|jgi:hypothetical protein|uniref:hypothetical protein n=1 Tax=Acidiferrobacter sp. SPIII_3 TaxID=1281578 RepID=UPI00143DA605|nr:hypothetical protein [Acidiferrobacter sp. SPIII_3]